MKLPAEFAINVEIPHQRVYLDVIYTGQSMILVVPYYRVSEDGEWCKDPHAINGYMPPGRFVHQYTIPLGTVGIKIICTEREPGNGEVKVRWMLR